MSLRAVNPVLATHKSFGRGQSDHSVPPNISPENYDYVVQLVRRHGVYPLHLEEFDLPEIR